MLAAADLDHVALRVRNLATALHFWHELLGLPLVNAVELEAGAARMATLSIGGRLIDLVPDPAAAPAGGEPRAGLVHLCVTLPDGTDMEAAARRLREAGVTVLEGPVERQGARGAGWSLYVRDQDGNELEIKSYPRRNEAP
ncbi:MAG TPA: VOC family protein [Dehalococcoidia bacterium]